jgi:hypothetical protein
VVSEIWKPPNSRWLSAGRPRGVGLVDAGDQIREARVVAEGVEHRRHAEEGEKPARARFERLFQVADGLLVLPEADVDHGDIGQCPADVGGFPVGC